jgi:hypothetical protein
MPRLELAETPTLHYGVVGVVLISKSDNAIMVIAVPSYPVNDITYHLRSAHLLLNGFDDRHMCAVDVDVVAANCYSLAQRTNNHIML